MSDSPLSLYDISIKSAVCDIVSTKIYPRKEFRILPDHVLCDFYYRMYLDKRLCLLSLELCDFEIFTRMLKVKQKRTQFFIYFQAVLDHEQIKIMNKIITGYSKQWNDDGTVDLHVIDQGLRIGTFFCEGGWFTYSHDIFRIVEEYCLKAGKNVQVLRRLLDCCHRRIYVESSYWMFKEAENTFKLANKTVKELEELDSLPNLAGLYANFSNLYGKRSEYEEAYQWAKKSIRLLNKNVPIRMIVEVLRLCSKACVFKRRFTQAGILIEQAVTLSEQLYKDDGHPSYSDTLMDYGFYLLNSDNIDKSVKIYKKCLNIRKSVFGKNNYRVALAYEDLAYALYVKEYNSGKFFDAREYADNAISIMEKILPEDHLALASTNRVKALILEEIAIDMRDPWCLDIQEKFLKNSEQLHQTSLKLFLSAFGERNVQTAKLYGNLGRLYQTMSLYEKAEQMHLQAIAIKEELLGSDDYEVGLSVGHLASLYNFHMKRYRDAEKLYLRSIDISLKLFGPSYSGLVYDYRGLIKVYKELQEISELLYISQVMRDWKQKRQSLDILYKPPVDLMTLDSIVDKFFTLC